MPGQAERPLPSRPQATHHLLDAPPPVIACAALPEDEMKSSAPLRTGGSILTAAFLTLVLATQAIAATWSQPIPLTSSGKAYAGVPGLVTLGTSHVVAAYLNNGRVIVRRSTNGGATWLAPQRLALDAISPAIAGRGTSVDVVWYKNSRVRYARSTNSGASFRTTVALSPGIKIFGGAAVGRGANGLVVVAWMQATRMIVDGPFDVYARVSTNGGASFGQARLLGEGHSLLSRLHGKQLSVAAGTGVAYVAYSGWDDIDYGVHVRSTRDGGGSWAPSTFFAGQYSPALSMTAAGRQAYVAYERYADYCDNDGCIYENWIEYRRTTDRGSNWSAARNLTMPDHGYAGNPVISLKGGVVRAAFQRSMDGNIWYSQSSNGLSWTPPEQVSPNGAPAGVGHATRIIVLYSNEDNVFVRTGSP
jgi:hypothetical protein